jgi:hypothetical protein
MPGGIVGRSKKARFLDVIMLILLLAAMGAMNTASAAGSDDHLIYSPDAPGKPIPVAIALEIENIPQIDEVAEQFGVDGDLLASWNAPRLAYIAAKPSDPDKIYQLGTIWMPSLDMFNAVSPRDKRYQSLTVSPDGTVHYAERFHANLSSRLCCGAFPSIRSY